MTLPGLLRAAARHRGDGLLTEAAAALDDALAVGGSLDGSLLAERDILAGQIRLDQGRHAEARAHLADAVARLSTSDDHDLLVHARVQLGAVDRADGRYDQARRTLDAALDHAVRHLGVDAPATARVHNELGVLAKATGDHDAALAHYHAALPVVLGHHGDSSEQVATLYHNLGGIQFVRGELDEAARWARRGLRIRQEVCGADHITVTYDQAALVPILIHRGEYASARTLLDVVVPRLERRFGPAHYEVAVALTNLGVLEAHEGRWALAFRHLRRAATIKREALGPDNPELVGTLANLAVAAGRVGEDVVARECRGEALRVAQARLPVSHPLRRALETPADDAGI